MTTYDSWGHSELVAELERRDRIQGTCEQCGKDYVGNECPECGDILGEALAKIFNYLNHDERKDYLESEDDGLIQDNHIYTSIIVLGEYLGMDMKLN